MRVRKGRRNIIEFVNEEIVRKISVINEATRPHRLKVEAWALSQARSQGINVPRVIDYYRDQKGREILVLERIHGKPLSLNPAKENTIYISDVGQQLVSLRNIGVNYGWIDPESYKGSNESWQSFILWYTQTYGKRLVKDNIIAENDFRQVYEALERVNPIISVPYLVNRDVRLPNIISDNKRQIWIVDWENVILGDPLYDLALFGARYGHGILWKNLRLGYRFSHLPQSYILYEIVGLIGMIDFYQENNINYKGRLKQLQRLLTLI